MTEPHPSRREMHVFVASHPAGVTHGQIVSALQGHGLSLETVDRWLAEDEMHGILTRTVPSSSGRWFAADQDALWTADGETERQLREAERQAAAAYLTAVIARHQHSALAELRRVNDVLRENGMHGPLGADGVKDVFSSMGALQLEEEHVPVLVKLAEYALGYGPVPRIALDAPEEELVTSIVPMLRRAAGR